MHQTFVDKLLTLPSVYSSIGCVMGQLIMVQVGCGAVWRIHHIQALSATSGFSCD